MTAQATYEIFIDWDNDGGLFAGNFEGTLDSWGPVGTLPPDPELSSAFAHLSSQSMQITWDAYTAASDSDTGVEFQFGSSSRGFDAGRFAGGSNDDIDPPGVVKSFANLIPGRAYDLSFWAYVPTGGEHVVMSVDSIATSEATSVNDEWQKISVSFTALGTSHLVTISPAGDTAGGEVTYIDEIMYTGPGENVTDRVLGLRTPLGIQYGRDTARSLSLVQPGTTSLEINNSSHDYSPDNPNSVIAGFLSSGKQVLIKATYEGSTHVLFSGYLNDYTITPGVADKSIQLSCLDALSKLDTDIFTDVFDVVRSGDAVNAILDAVGWPSDKRDIDPGGTVIQWFCIDTQSGLEALGDVLSSEGPPSIAYVDSGNNFVFRDRHHRLIRPASIFNQATFVDQGPEPQFSDPFTYDIGWTDVVNSVSVSIDQREVGEQINVFESTDTIVIAGGETRTISVAADDAFIEAIVPQAGVDFQVSIGSNPMVSLSRTSGKSVDVMMTGVTACTIVGLNLRAKPITAARTYSVNVQDQESVNGNGLKSWDGAMPWASINDAYAVAALILGQRSQRLPIVSITVNNGYPERLRQILSRDLSDRIHIVETETFTDHDFYVEQVQHNVNDIGANHAALFSAERIRTQVSPVFTFDDSSRGFDVGLFGVDGLDNPAEVFLLDVSALDSGLLAT